MKLSRKDYNKIRAMTLEESEKLQRDAINKDPEALRLWFVRGIYIGTLIQKKKNLSYKTMKDMMTDIEVSLK